MQGIIYTLFRSIVNQIRRAMAPAPRGRLVLRAEPFKFIFTRMKIDRNLSSSRVPGEADLMNKRQVAEMLGKTPRTVDNWRKRLGLPFYKVGRAVYFKRSEVLGFMARFMANGSGWISAGPS